MMTSVAARDAYRLIDAGDGRRLEQFGARIVDRPAPTASARRRDPGAWRQADLRFDRDRGWSADGGPLDSWRVEIEGVTIELRAVASGQVGLFPEQEPNWRWIAGRVSAEPDEPPCRVLNLFGYTGVATLVAARAGAAVAHVDGSRPTVAWARRNAELSGLSERPIRWLVDDAAGFVHRERRRSRRYDLVVLDPPSYGHGRGGTWRLQDRLPDLLIACAGLLSDRGAVLLTAHTPGLDPEHLGAILATAVGAAPFDIDTGELSLHAESGAVLPLGTLARWSP